jgi:hypothetical protein
MNLPFKRRSEFDGLFRSRRRFPGWAGGILAFVLVIALVWYLFFERVADTPSPQGVASEPAAGPAREKSKIKPDKTTTDDDESDDDSDSDDEDEEDEDDTESDSGS